MFMIFLCRRIFCGSFLSIAFFKSRNAEPEQEMTSELLKKLEDEKKAKEAEEVAAKKKAALEIKPIFPATTGKILFDC